MAEKAEKAAGPEIVGKSPRRLDGRAKVTGQAQFIEDLHFKGMLYGKVLRSSRAHARIVSIDVSRAEALPGVRGVVVGEDLPFLHGEAVNDKPLLARGKVRYIGEAVAAVAAVTERIAEEAVELIEVEYEDLPAVFDPVESAGPDAPLIHEGLGGYRHAPGIKPLAGTNVCNHYLLDKGNVEEAFARSDRIFEDSYSTPMVHHAFIEPHGAVCLIDDEDNVTLHANNDSPYRCCKELSRALGLPTAKIRVICVPYVGGNFGGKGGLQAEALSVALAWKIRNKPVRIVYSREEEFCSAVVRHPARIHIKTGVASDGTMLARQVTMHWATGAYAEKGPTVCRFGGVSGAGPYNIPNVRIEGFCAYTNRQVAGAMRGYSGPQAAWAYESHMDAIAAGLGLDPLEFRLRHVYQDGDRHNSGQVLSSEGLKECLETVAEKMEWTRKKLGPDQGRGLACMERAVKTPFGSAAFLKINEDGTVGLLSSTTEVGQGSETVLCQIAAEELGVPLEWVRKATPDTAVTPYDTSTTSSRSTFHMGNAVVVAAQDARQQLIRIASDLMEADPADLDVKGGRLFVRGSPERSMTIGDALTKKFGSSGTVLGRGWYYPEIEAPGEYFSDHMIFWLLGAQGAEVEVDRETGQVKILKIYAAHDVGRAIHPGNCLGQTEGGVSMGVGYAMYENYLFKQGRMMNPSYLHYKLPSALEMPEVETDLIECHHDQGPYGAKGVGETTNVACPPAISNAIFDAVGVRIHDLPITPDKILRALEKVES